MNIDIGYGKEDIQRINIPDENLIGVVYPRDVKCDVPDKIIDASIESPMESDSFERFLEGGEDIVFIVNDGTRPTPTSKVLDVLSKRMDLRKARYLIATGNHRNMTLEEYVFVFGKHYAELKDRIYCHDSKQSEVAFLGTSKNGTPIELNKIAVNADRLIVITSVEPHYFAGYTGGRKSFLPGIASFNAIEANHKLAMKQEAQVLVLEGNPVHEDMMDALERISGKKIFSIQIVMDRYQNVYKCTSGDINFCFKQAVMWAEDVFCAPIPEKADVVISVAPYPMDVDLYQSQKALDNGKWALKNGGKIIMVSKCRNGVGHTTFLQQLSSSKNPKEVLKNLNREYKLGYHKAAKIAEIAVWADIWAVTSLDPKIINSANMTPFQNVEIAVKEVLRENPNSKFIVIMDGSVTVPKVKQ